MAKRTSPEARIEFFAGVKATLPLLFGVIPFGVTFGVLALASGVPSTASLGMSSIVFAGSSQVVGVQLLGAAVPVVVILFTTFMVNLRHLLYSASLAPHLKHLRSTWKLVLSYLLTDEAYAVTIAHYNKEVAMPDRHWYFLGAGMTMWSTWQLSTFIGVFLGAILPRTWPLDFTLTLTFIALAVPMITGRPTLAASISAGIVAVLGVGLPLRLNLVLAVIFAIGVGLLTERLELGRR